MFEKAEELLKQLETVEEELGKSDPVSNPKQYKELSQEHARLLDIKKAYDAVKRDGKALQESRSLLVQEKDLEMIAIIEEEIKKLEVRLPQREKALERLLIPTDPNDDKSTLLELRAGTGGEEAALFVADCARMYRNFATSRGWQCEVLSCSGSEKGGYKEYVMVFSGRGVHRELRYEGGTHRVQRVPETEAQGRIHTSAVTIAVLMEPDEDEKITLEDKDLRIETYRASGAGGQHVNTTDSAVRITHIPTGIVAQSQEERSQHKNKDKALRVLKAKVAEKLREEKAKKISELRASQVGSGDRSERIRTYNFPQNRVTDHRIDLTLYKLDRIMEGDLDELVNALIAHYRSF